MTWFFLRARPLRAGGVIAGAVTAALVIATMLLQALGSSGAQTADQTIGAADYQLQLSDSIAVGSDGATVDKQLIAAMTEAGAANPVISYKEFDMSPDALPDLSFMVEENDWTSNPFPARIHVTEGRVPADIGEIAVSSVIADQLPLGSRVSFLDGAITVTVVGVIMDDFARKFPFAIAPPGTWNSMDAPADLGERFSQTASRIVFWSDSEATNVVEAIAGVIAGSGSEEAAESLEQQLNSREVLEDFGSTDPIEVTLLLITAPLLAGLFGTWGAGRFVNRIRQTMLTIGIARNRTRAAAAGSIFAAILFGVLIGAVVGVAVGLGIRPLLDAVSEKALGPVTGMATTIFTIAAGAIIGTALGIVALVRNPSVAGRKKQRAGKKLKRGWTLRQVAPALSVVFVFVGVFLLQGTVSFDQSFLAAMSFGMALVILTPFALDLFLIRRPRALHYLFASRRLRADRKLSSLVSIGVGALVVLSFGLSTLFYSAVSATNDLSESSVAASQIQVQSPESGKSLDELSTSLAEYVGINDPVLTSTADGFSEFGDGSTIVVSDQTDLERLLSRDLKPAEAEVLTSGGTLRTKGPDVTEMQFESESGDIVAWPAMTLVEIDPSFRNFDGFILAKTSADSGLTSSNQKATFVDATAEQIEKARDAYDVLAFDRTLVNVYQEPDVISEPIGSTVSALAIAIIAGFLITFYASSNATALRPTFSGMRAVGIGRPWFSKVLAYQTGSVLLVALVIAAIAALLGVLAMFSVGALDIAFHVPWLSIGITVVGLLGAGAAGTALSVRRLNAVERMV